MHFLFTRDFYDDLLRDNFNDLLCENADKSLDKKLDQKLVYCLFSTTLPLKTCQIFIVSLYDPQN